jgi:WD40 repeat protein
VCPLSRPAVQVHIYDVKTLQCYTPSNAADHHVGGLNQVRCSSDGKQYASAGKDGAIKLWDVVSNTCVGTLAGAHDKMVRAMEVLLFSAVLCVLCLVSSGVGRRACEGPTRIRCVSAENPARILRQQLMQTGP